MITKIMVALPARVVLVCASESLVNARNRFPQPPSRKTEDGHQPRINKPEKVESGTLSSKCDDLLLLAHVQPMEVPDNEYTYSFYSLRQLCMILRLPHRSFFTRDDPRSKEHIWLGLF
ncbi:hypothetical protein AKN94_01665 [Thiopseudomonas alkaliphila]|nr:hypothetical protein AKN94_01665 [Thiopseudomonas alkaliphila]